ncbi:MAG: PIG-L family deacetylase [Kiritimatiellales bacterium]|jgi:LmbE family N-acetylglucosaminyl deacetylase
MNPYLKFVQQIEAQIKSAKAMPHGGPVSAVPGTAADVPDVLLFSPHPDDECITGLLPLRLMREAGMKIINVPVTFGSNAGRQPGRAAELRNACGFLGWEIFQRPEGFRSLEKADLVEILKTVRPAIIFVPHSKDWNSRHISTHFLVMDALAEMGKDFSCTVIETEYWQAMEAPNLMVEADAAILADLVAALSFHVKEVERNPYHLSLPAWMQDNVRRGGELVGGQGGAVPNFTFATLYRLRRWKNGICRDALERGRFVSMADNLKELLKWK